MGHIPVVFGATLLAISTSAWAAEGDEAAAQTEETAVTTEESQESAASSGSILERSRLTGDWGGLRTDLEHNGVSFKIGLTQVLQNNARGGHRTEDGIKYSGSLSLDTMIDTGKIGLWKGGTLLLHAEGKWGDGIDHLVGTLGPVNLDAVKPGTDNGAQLTLSEIIYMHALFKGKLILIGGKLDGSRAFDKNAFANDERTQFMNVSLRNNPVIPPFLPYTNWGVGFILNPTDWFRWTAAVADSEGRANTTGFETAFHGPTSTTVISDINFKVNPFGKPGNYLAGFAWSSMDTRHIEPPSPFRETGDMVIGLLGLERAGKVVGALANNNDSEDNIAVYAGFDQYIYTEAEDPTQGIGIFGRFGWARPDVNPVNHFYSIGVGGKGVIPGRDNDTFGVGYFHMDLSDRLPSTFVQEAGIEFYYNIQVTPWLHVSPDIQYIFNPGGTDDARDAIVVGIRTQMTL